jgi:replicative DNA helicase
MNPRDSMDIGVRVPPHSNGAEQSVLGGLMLRPDGIDVVSSHLDAEDFYRGDHRLIFRAMVALSARGTPCDAITLGEWFAKNDFDQVPPAYLMQLANDTPSAANIVAYARIVREKSIRRRVIAVASDLVENAFGVEQEAMDLVDGVIGQLMGMQHIEQNTEYTLRQALTIAYEAATAAKERGGKIPGIPTGLTELDDVLGGLHKSDLIIVGARPAMGKTALLLNMALGHDGAAGLISTEQPVVQIGSRILAIEGGINASRLRNGSHDEDDLGRMANAVGNLMDRELMICDQAGVTIGEVQRVARRWKQKHGIQRLLVDYVQRIKGNDPRASRIDQVGDVAIGLKDIARELDIPVVALAQVNREVEKRGDKRPNIGDLANSSEIEKEADQVLMLYRDEVYNKQSPDKGIAEISVEKNRHGPTGFVRAVWQAETMRFRDMSHHGAYDY